MSANFNLLNPDLTYLLSVSNGDKRFEKMLINTSIQSIDSKMMDVTSGLTEKDADKLRKAVHSLKPLFAVVGYNEMQKICSAAELQLAVNGFQQSCEIDINTLKSKWPEAKKVLLHLFEIN